MSFRFLPVLFSFAFIFPFTGSGNDLANAQQKGADNGIKYAKVLIRRSPIRFPRLSYFRNREVMRLVNRQIDEVTREFGCGEASRNSYFRVRSAVEYAENDIFSIYATAEYYCGTAYPTNDANNSMTFDLRNGKQVKFEDLFTDYESDRQHILKIIFAKQISHAEKLVASGKPRDNTCEGDYELYSMEHLEGSTFGFNFSKAGLRVQPEWPHVIEACSKLVTVPYAQLKKFALPGGLLARVTK